MIKYGLNLNLHSDTFKNSVVNTSGCKYWEIIFDPDDKDTYMILKQSSNDQYVEIGFTDGENHSDVIFLFYYTIQIGSESKCYSLATLVSRKN
jgi:hypothetical protein